MANILGASIGPALHRLARGVDDRPVAERAEAKQISAESTFAADLTTLEQLQDSAGPIAEHAHRRLTRDGRGARTVTVKLKKADMSHADQLGDPAVRHRRCRDTDRHRPPAAARSP